MILRDEINLPWFHDLPFEATEVATSPRKPESRAPPFETKEELVMLPGPVAEIAVLMISELPWHHSSFS